MSVRLQSRRRILAASVGLVSLGALHAQGATFSWNDTTFASGTPGTWANSNNWLPVGNPGSSDLAVFGATAASGTAGDVTNVVDANTTIASLVYQPISSSSQFQTTQINSGVTLNVNGSGGTALLVGDEGTLTGGSTTAIQLQANITGAGALSINNPTGLFLVRQSFTSGSTQKATLDLSGLNSFTANVSEMDIGVGSTSTNNAQGGRAIGTLSLATTNIITAGIVRVGAEQSGNVNASSIFLGNTNTINAGTVAIAERRGTGQMQFQSTVTNGTLVIRGQNGTGAATFLGLGVQPTGNNGDTSTGNGGTIDLTSGTGRGHGSIDALASTVILGRQGTNRQTGRLTYDLGGVVADNVTLGDGNAVSAPTALAIGILQVQGTGTMIVNGSMTLGKNSGSATSFLPVGSLTLGTTTTPGGDIRVAGDILDGGGTSTISVNGGNLQARTIGTAASPIDAMTLNGGTLTVSLGTGGTAVNVGALTANANANGNITIHLNVAGQVALGQQKLIDYSTIAGTGFGAFSLAPKFPARLQATLVDNTGDSVDVNVTSFDTPKWTGTGGASSDWDINQSQNWVLVNAGTPTTYQEDLATYTTTDNVLFDDSATTRTVNITTNVSPNSVTVNSSGNYTFSGPGAIIGGNPITKSGSGKLIMANSGANANGVVTLNGGILQIGDGVTSGVGNIGGPIVANSGATVLLNRPDNFTFPNAVSGSGAVEKTGAGIATLSAASSYNGPTTIDSGTLVASTLANIGSSSPIGAGDNTSGTTNQNSLVLNGGTLRWTGGSSQTSNRALTLTATGGTIDASPTGSFGLNLNATTLSVNMSGTGSRTLTLTGIDPAPLLVSGQQIGLLLGDPSGGTLQVVKNGNVSWQLNGTNTYTGGTVINSGRVRTGNATAFGTGSVQVANGAQAYINTVATFGNDFSIAGIGPTEQPTGDSIQGNFGALRLAATNSFVSGKVVLTGDARITARSTSGGVAGTISGQVTGPFNLEIGNAGSGGGTLALANSSNDWSGNTTVSHGELRLAASEVIPNGPGKGNVTVNGSSSTVDAVLNVNGNTETINGLNSSGDLTHVRVTNGATATNGTLIIGDNNASGNYGGVIQNGTATLAITKIGSGVQTLSGSNTYTGPTTIAGGTLLAKAPAHAAILANAIINAGSLQLDYSGGAQDPGPTVQAALKDSYSQSFVGGAIRTTNAADPTRAIGWADDMTNSLVTVRYTYNGDANLDGQVTTSDFTLMAQNFNSSTNVNWATGDFNYDGVVNALDFNALASSFGMTPVLSSPALSSPGLTSALGTLVPEPTSLAMLALGGLVAARRRRRP